MIYWFTGQPGSGKSTLAAALKSVLQARGDTVVHLDGEELRAITGNRDYSESGRIWNIRTGQRLAAKLHTDGIIVVASFVSPYRWLREEFKKEQSVCEIYAHTTRITGKESFFVETFEPPLSNFVDMDTTVESAADCIQRILNRI